MLNKCTDKVWFVVELCESIKAFKVELANFELYSSVPKDLRISMGNVFPGRDKDWSLLGEFVAEEDRTVQTFVSEAGVFGKYVKVEVLTHYGNEHFCPVSLFKIFGISDFDLIIDDDDDDEPLPLPPPTTTESPIPDMTSLTKMDKEGLFTGVFPPSMQVGRDVDMAQALNQTSLIGTTFAYNVSCPDCDANRFRDVYFLLAFSHAQLLKNLKMSIGLQSALMGQVCRSYGFQSMDQVPMPSYAGFRLLEFYATLFGASRIMALCNLMGIQSGQSILADQHLVIPPPMMLVDPPNKEDVIDNDDSKIKVTGSDVVEKPTNTPGKGDKPSGDDVSKPVVSSPQAALPDKDRVAPTKVKSDDSKISADAISSSPSVPVKIDPTPASDQTAKPAAQPSVPKDKVAGDGTPAIKDTGEASNEPPSPPASKVTGAPAGSGGGVDSPTTNNGQQSGHKAESVWQKLSHKIKNLERNVSLSGGYLEQLSVQYKKQIEDLQLAVRQSGEALAAASKARELDRTQISDLQEQIGQLKIVVEEVSSRLETMGTWVITILFKINVLYTD